MIKKFLFTTCIALLLVVTGSAQTPYWQWARSPQGVYTFGQACCTDVHGNVYAAGFFYGTALFGADTITDTDGPFQNIFIVKYDALGNVKWVRSGNGYADAYGLSADDYGNVYLAGDFYSDSISFGSSLLVNPVSGTSNGYLIKYDSSGDVLWAKDLGGKTNDYVSGVSTDHSGNVYVTGYFTGDSLVLDNTVLHQSGVDNVFLAKFNSSGTAIWANSEGGTGTDGPSAVTTDSLGNIFITGYFSSATMTFGTVTLSSPYMNNAFVTKYDSSGNVRWAKYFGGNNPGSAATSLSADASGNVYVTGYYIDTIAIGNNTLVAVGQQNIFVTKYDSSGTVSWAQSAGGTNVDLAGSISADAAGNSYVTGYYESDTVVFATDTLINLTGNPITFVAKYDPSGHVQWGIATTGGNTENQAAGIAYSSGGIYIAGSYGASAITFGSDTLFSPATQGCFIARIGLSGTTGITPIGKSADLIRVYPDPSSGSFYFSGIAKGNTIEIYDLMGRSIYSSTAAGDDYLIDLSGKSKGMYFYQVSDHNTPVQSGKLILE